MRKRRKNGTEQKEKKEKEKKAVLVSLRAEKEGWGKEPHHPFCVNHKAHYDHHQEAHPKDDSKGKVTVAPLQL